MKQAESIHYDIHAGNFYRVGKQTGTMQQSYVNGEVLPTFKPGVTGFSYLSRRNIKSRSKSKKPKLNFHAKSLSKRDNYKTLDLKPKSYFLETTFSNSKTFRSPALSFYDSLSSPRSFSKEDRFQQLSRQFQDLNSSKVSQNHSPKKQTLSGSVPAKRLTDELCMTKTKFPNIDTEKTYIEEKEKERKKRSIKAQKIPKQCEQLQQIRKERGILYKYRPELLERENSRSLQKQKERRKNLLILQRLAIKVMNKRTKNAII